MGRARDRIRQEREEEAGMKRRRIAVKKIGLATLAAIGVTVSGLGAVKLASRLFEHGTLFEDSQDTGLSYHNIKDELRRLSMEIDEANSIEALLDSDIIVYVADFHTSKGVDANASKLERILSLGLEISGIGLEGLAFSADPKTIKELAAKCKGWDAHKFSRYWKAKAGRDNLGHEFQVFEQECKELAVYFSRIGNMNAENIEIVSTRTSEAMNIALTIISMNAEDFRLLAPGIQYVIRTPRIISGSTKVFGMEDEQGYEEKYDKLHIERLLEKMDYIQNWLAALPKIEAIILRELDRSEKERMRNILNNNRDKTIYMLSLIEDAVKKIAQKYAESKEPVKPEYILSNKAYEASPIVISLLEGRSIAWVNNFKQTGINMPTAGYRPKRRLFVAIGGENHGQTFRDAAKNAGYSVINVKYDGPRN